MISAIIFPLSIFKLLFLAAQRGFSEMIRACCKDGCRGCLPRSVKITDTSNMLFVYSHSVVKYKLAIIT